MSDTAIEAEKSVIGAIMMSPRCLPRVRAIITPAHCSSPRSRILLESLYAMADGGTPIDLVSLYTYLEDRGLLSSAGGVDAVMGLADLAATSANVEHHARTIVAAFDARALRDWAARIVAEAGDIASMLNPGSRVAETWRAIADHALKAMHTDAGLSSSMSERDATTEAIQLIQRRYEARQAGRRMEGCHEVPHKKIDDLLGGFDDGNTYLIGARTGAGKTAFARDIASRIAQGWRESDRVVDGVGGEYYSTEVEPRDLAIRGLAGRARIDGLLLRQGHIEDRQIDDLAHAVSQVRALKTQLHYHSQPGMTMEWIRDSARHRAALLSADGRKIGPIWIDYAQDVRTSRDFRVERERLAYIANESKRLARELDTPVIQCAQILKPTRGQETRRPTLGDIRGGDDLANPASGVILLHRPGIMGGDQGPGYTEAIVAKARNGVLGMECGWFFGAHQRFEFGTDRATRAMQRQERG